MLYTLHTLKRSGSLGVRLHVYMCVYTLTIYSIRERLGELEYRRVQLHGHFDHSKELLMWPRSLNTESMGRGEPGAHVITPFYCEELGQFVLVNRGWVPRRKMDQSTRSKGQVGQSLPEINKGLSIGGSSGGEIRHVPVL